jgi:hypothetical protein
MTNLETLQWTELSLPSQQREVLANCFLGTLSMVVSKEIWNAALKNAVNTAKNLRPESEKGEL